MVGGAEEKQIFRGWRVKTKIYVVLNKVAKPGSFTVTVDYDNQREHSEEGVRMATGWIIGRSWARVPVWVSSVRLDVFMLCLSNENKRKEQRQKHKIAAAKINPYC